MKLKERVAFYLRNPSNIFVSLIIRIPYFGFIKYTCDYQNTITFKGWFFHKVLNIGDNQKAYWPVHPTSKVVNPMNIYAGIDTCPGLMGGCYIQGIGKVFIDDYTQIAPQVVIISANHDLYNNKEHIIESVRIGKYCWLGAGCKIMPGVVLGDFTIVAAGAIVTKSFSEGYCVLAGVPAKKIKELDADKCVWHTNKYAYNGYIPSTKFEKYRKQHLNV